MPVSGLITHTSPEASSSVATAFEGFFLLTFLYLAMFLVLYLFLFYFVVYFLVGFNLPQVLWFDIFVKIVSSTGDRYSLSTDPDGNLVPLFQQPHFEGCCFKDAQLFDLFQTPL